MAGYPIKKNTAFTFYVALTSQASRPQFQANPTLAAGDVKVAIDDGALNDLATLPDAQPDGSKVVRVQLSQAEMNGDTIQVLFSDAAGAEWDDLFVEIVTGAGQIDADVTSRLAPTTAGRTLDVSATGEAGLDFDNIKDATGAHTLTNITVPIVTAATLANGAHGGAGTTITLQNPIYADLRSILGTALTETAGQIAAAFKKFFDKAAPTGTVNSLPDAVAGANGGLPVLNAALEVPKVKAVTDAVTVTPAPPTANAIADQVWDEGIAGHVAAGSTGKALTDLAPGAAIVLNADITEIHV